MTGKTLTAIAALFAISASLSSCGNTIRGMGQDAANTVNATQDAGHRVGKAAQ
jgi:entericidin B